MDKKTERAGKRAAVVLEGEVDFSTGIKRIMIEREDVVALLEYVKALEEPPVKVTTDVYLRGDWHVTILKMDLDEDQVRLLDELGDRSKDASTTIEVHEHNPNYPLRDWKGYVRK